MKRLSAVLTCILLSSIGEGTTSTWDNTGGGDWGDTTNWSNGMIPNAVGDEAEFLTDPTTPGATIVSSIVPITLGTLNINNPPGLEFSSMNFIFQTNAGNPLLTVGANQYQIISSTTLNFPSSTNPTYFNIGSNSTLGLDSTPATGRLFQEGAGTILFTGTGGGSNFQLTMNGGTTEIGLAAIATITVGQGVVVNPGATLSGFGTLNTSSSQVLNNGTVMPGDPTTVGTLTFMGEGFDNGQSGRVEISAINTVSYDQLALVGNSFAVIEGGTLVLNASAGTFTSGQQIPVITSTSPIQGTFNSFLPSLPPGIEANILYTTNAVNILFMSGSDSSTWVNVSGGDWNDTGNWSNGVVPNGTGAIAIFNTEPTTNPIITSTLNPITLGTLDINNPTTLDFTVPNFTFNMATGSPALFVGNDQSHTITGSSLSFSEPTYFEIKSGSLLNLASATETGSLFKEDRGTLLFTGTGGGATFQLTVDGGVAQIGTAPTDVVTIGEGVIVNLGGTLSGFGTINTLANTVQNNGLVMPGSTSAVGTLTITGGGYTSFPSATLLIDANNVSSYDQLAVVGTTSIGGGTLIFNAPNGVFFPGEEIPVLTSTGAVTGTFSAFDPILPLGLEATLEYGTNAITVLFSVGGTLPPLARGYINLTDPLILIENGHIDQLRCRLEKLRCRMCSCSPCNQNSVYLSAFGSWGELDRIKSQVGYDFDSAGFLVGSDQSCGSIGWGGYLSYERLHASVDDYWGNFYVDNLLGKIYATWISCGPLFANFAAGGGYNWFDISRHSTSDTTGRGAPGGWEANVWGEIGYETYFREIYYLSPLASLDYNYFNISSYTETGAGPFGIHVSEEGIHSLRSSLGMIVGKSMSGWRCITATPEVRISWVHEFLNRNRTVVISALSYSAVEDVTIFTTQDDFVNFGGTLSLYTNRGLSLTASYDYFWNKQISINEVYGELALSF